jgi:hypothetical protein
MSSKFRFRKFELEKKLSFFREIEGANDDFWSFRVTSCEDTVKLRKCMSKSILPRYGS